MPPMAGLNERYTHILRDVVDVYTETGQPVGSKYLAERQGYDLSSATVRNAMADLETLGLLTSPHTSAGRVPTEEGFRYYVKSLAHVPTDLDARVKAELDRRLTPLVDTPGAANRFPAVMRDVSRLLAQLTSCAGLVLAPKVAPSTLTQIEFLRLGGDKVLVVLVTDSGAVENRLIRVPLTINDSQLKAAGDQLRGVVRGKTLSEAYAAILDTLTRERMAVDALMGEMMGGLTPDSENALMVGGSQNLFGYPELMRDRLQELFRVFEEKRLLAGLLAETARGDGVQIYIGTECPLEAAKDCAMVTSTYGSADKRLVGTLGVIGPLRMNYRQTIALVDYTAKVLGRVFDDFRPEETR
jgi:heat-inducible transcriptional repressor